ncbi:MAG: hypothetical protein NTX59_12890 [Elusimicrobia bacterium]|nr:hypothetical protein [Elusimicrobiota bacterium]
MDDKKTISDEEAKVILALKEVRLATIKKIRSGGNERYIGLIISAGILLSPILFHFDQETTNFALLLGIIVGLGWQQKRNENRFDELIDFLEREGVIRK